MPDAPLDHLTDWPEIQTYLRCLEPGPKPRKAERDEMCASVPAAAARFEAELGALFGYDGKADFLDFAQDVLALHSVVDVSHEEEPGFGPIPVYTFRESSAMALVLYGLAIMERVRAGAPNLFYTAATHPKSLRWAPLYLTDGVKRTPSTYDGFPVARNLVEYRMDGDPPRLRASEVVGREIGWRVS